MTKTNKAEPVSTETPDLLAQRAEWLKEVFPDAVTEGKVDFERLRATLGEELDEGPERYSFTWAGKRDAIRILQMPSRATLVPVPEESINFDTTNNLFIEGDNLEVMKLLYKSYFGRVKMIYIDPPYNTGNDVIYKDNFADPLDTYLRLTDQKSGDGDLLTTNPETSGRYHSAWLSMMYPRLFLARQLLRDDGLIFVSIDDHEAHNLRMIMNQVFGDDNFIAKLVWEKGRKNDAKLFSVGHEYMLVYARSLAGLRQQGTVWREPKPGALEIWSEYTRLRDERGQDDQAIEEALRRWYKDLPNRHPSKALSRYRHVDQYGPWRDRDISWPGGGGPRYDVVHPETGQPCKVPERGWGFATAEAMQEQIKLGLVLFRADHTEPPIRKAHLRPVAAELSNEDESFSNGEDGEEATEVGMQVMPSVIYKQSQVTVKYLRHLMGAKVFDNPKDHEVLGRIIRYCTLPAEGAVVMDFFAGSASTAEAVLRSNVEEGGNRRFVMIQLPEPTPDDSVAREIGFNTISELGKERIRRVINRLREEAVAKAGADDVRKDLGFRVFRLAESSFRSWSGVEDADPKTYADQMALFADPLVADWKSENVVWEIALKEGLTLSSRADTVPGIKNTVVRVTDPEKGQVMLICLDGNIEPNTPKALGLSKEDLFICRDAALDDELAANLALQCRLKTI